MKLVQRKQTRRAAFTLIELLVVIAIIAILVSLTAAAVVRALNNGNMLVARSDISQLSNAVGAFKQRFGVYPPSRLRLAMTPQDYPTGTAYDAQLSGDSIQFIQRCFPRFYDNWTKNNNANYWGPSIPSGKYLDLEGEQCLVFCLGGVQGSTNGIPGVIGFSTNPSDPMNITGDRIAPFFDFNAKSNRLNTSIGPFFAFNDPWGTPYAYFSSGKRRNGYNAYYAPPPATPAAAQQSDCTTLGVWPYGDPNNNYLNADSFQIISAGPDKTFGQGSNLTLSPPPTWSQTIAGSTGVVAPGTAGLDDLSNFYEKALGAN
jgi:prepilin-type N-terminal cleavage/methylation domain-containing protein